MKITKRQLRRIIREEKSRLIREDRRRSRLRRIIREVEHEAAETGPETTDRAKASTSELKKWFMSKATGISDLDIPSTQIPSLVAAMEDVISAASAGRLKSKESYLSGQMSKISGAK